MYGDTLRRRDRRGGGVGVRPPERRSRVVLGKQRSGCARARRRREQPVERTRARRRSRRRNPDLGQRFGAGRHVLRAPRGRCGRVLGLQHKRRPRPRRPRRRGHHRVVAGPRSRRRYRRCERRGRRLLRLLRAPRRQRRRMLGLERRSAAPELAAPTRHSASRNDVRSRLRAEAARSCGPWHRCADRHGARVVGAARGPARSEHGGPRSRGLYRDGNAGEDRARARRRDRGEQRARLRHRERPRLLLGRGADSGQ